MTAPKRSCILAIAVLAAAALGPEARGQGACCTPDSCADAGSAAACAGFGGVFLEGTGCIDQPCGPGACCTGLACLDGFSAYDCISGGRDYAGGGTVCADDPCDIGVGACCTAGACNVTDQDACTAGGGAYLGPGSQCLQAPCVFGACCLPGSCTAARQFECNEVSGVFVIGGNCKDAGACDVTDNCPGDALASQSRSAVNNLFGLISDDDAALQRWDRFVEVSGAVDEVLWFGFDVEFTGGGFIECDDSVNLFLVEFYTDAGGGPGEPVCSYDFVTVPPSETGVLLDSFQLHEYRLPLDPPCVLTHGWLSIQGLGDDCWFAWASASVGDGQSLCDGCVQQLEPSDLAWCLLGEVGGHVGACCEESSADCSDDVDISDCTATDQRFVENAACAELDPPCAVVSGPCCLPNGGCGQLGEAACGLAGGSWQGPAADCSSCPVLGACCIDGTRCVLATEEGCLEEDLTWLGDNASCDDCPAPPACPADTLLSQQPDVPPSFFAGTSEQGSPFRRFEDVGGLAGAVDSLTWWGIDLQPQGNGWIECIEVLDEFHISFHDDAAGIPGDEVCAYTLLADKSVNGLSYGGTELNEYTVALPEPCPLASGWISIEGRGDASCWFLWLSATGTGESYCTGCTEPVQGVDLSVCLDGSPGGISGACCEPATAACDDDVDIGGCGGPGQHFFPGTACADIDPPCGVLEGACCLPNRLCTVAVETSCYSAGGAWLGADVPCFLCPCAASCPAGASTEGEPDCADGTVDTFNPGCESESPAFSPVALCETVCGTTGVFDGGKDYDWYEVSLDGAETLHWTVDAEFDVVAGIVDGNAGCGGLEVLAAEIGQPCEPLTLSASLEPGTYWVVVQPADNGDVLCGSSYTATLTGSVPCTLSCDGVADCADRDDNGVRDDPCLWWDCTDGTCAATDVVYADLGGPLGACPPDGAADGHDRFHALSCFANVDTAGRQDSYPCEPDAPFALNVDTAGPWGHCLPDGVCDANDAFAALNAFAGSTACACPDGPAPAFDPPLTATHDVILRAGRARVIEPRHGRPAVGRALPQPHAGVHGGVDFRRPERLSEPGRAR